MQTLEQIRAELKPIKTQEQYKSYLKIIDGLIDCLEDSPEEQVLELVSILVESYEAVHYPIEAPDPIEAIKYEMEEQGLKQKDLIQYFGSKEMVSQVLNKKRPLTLKIMKNLYQNFGISADSLLAV